MMYEPTCYVYSPTIDQATHLIRENPVMQTKVKVVTNTCVAPGAVYGARDRIFVIKGVSLELEDHIQRNLTRTPPGWRPKVNFVKGRAN